uniref:Serine aminopeptidase S33 domain-containing protein n=1 Tax=Hemiselmis tepida TaxID=464990 RepID=A0A7S0Z5Q1_9CRYP|mmetsp:Transcript_38824/g.99197  ORF Transcript_38824/g.99197 Transcript_38824/m.99197 type:complete len:280 (+) Transcript_38824:428-1267(+)
MRRATLGHRWEPPVGQAPKACLQILHGTVDHSNAYHDLATFLAGNGIAVHATDMRGWGLSDGDELFFDDPQAFIDDAVGMDAAFRRDPRYARVPNFILGKSIGGLVAARAVQQHPEVWKGGFIGLSPAYSLHREVQPTPILRVLLRVLNAVSPKLRVKPVFDPKLIVSDAAALERWKSDPLVSRGWATAAYLANLLDQMDRLHSDCSKGVSEPLDIPALMLLGTGDRVVSMQGLEDTCKLFRRGSRVTTYEGGFHNLLEEPAHKDRVKRDILAFIESQV